MALPHWTYEEVLVVYVAYLRAERKAIGVANQEALSRVLRSLPIHDPANLLVPEFRSPSAIAKRVANFQALDDESEAKGLDAGLKTPAVLAVHYRFTRDQEGAEAELERVLARLYAAEAERVAATVTGLRYGAAASLTLAPAPLEELVESHVTLAV